MGLANIKGGYRCAHFSRAGCRRVSRTSVQPPINAGDAYASALLEGDVLSDAHSYPVSPVLEKTIAADGARADGMGTERMPCHPRHGRCPGNTAFAEPHPNTPSEEMRCCVAGWLACARGIPQTQSPVYLLPA